MFYDETEFLWIYILLIHFLGDFALQTHEQAINKSKDFRWLMRHVAVYSLTWFIACIAIRNIIEISVFQCFIFAIVTFWCHAVTDYFTSRINKDLFDKNDLHNGFVGIGFDQILHYLQLYFTFKKLMS